MNEQVTALLNYIDRIEAINAELLAALKTACIDLDRLGGGEWAATYRAIVAKAGQVRS